jgi:hypothetical protein
MARRASPFQGRSGTACGGRIWVVV